MAIECTLRDRNGKVRYIRGIAASRPVATTLNYPEGCIWVARDGAGGARVFIRTRSADDTEFEWVALA